MEKLYDMLDKDNQREKPDVRPVVPSDDDIKRKRDEQKKMNDIPKRCGC
jgi:hypothetical protein